MAEVLPLDADMDTREEEDHDSEDDKEEFEEDEGYSEHYSLLEVFPAEVFFEILSHLKWNELCRASATCSFFHSLCTSRAMWLRLTELDFTMCRHPTAQRIMDTALRCPAIDRLCLPAVEDAGEELLFDLLQMCPDVREVALRGSRGIRDSTLQKLIAHETKLRVFEMRDQNLVSTRALEEFVAQQDCLEELHIHSCLIHNPQLSSPEQGSMLRLRRICFVKCAINDDSICAMSLSCPALQSLCLSQSFIRTFTSAEVQGGFLELQELDLSHCTELAVIELAGLDELEDLDCTGCSFLRTVHLATRKLQRVCLKDCETLVQVAVSSRCMEELDLSDLPHLSRLTTADCSQLRHLNVARDVHLPLSVLETLSVLPQLEHLNIVGCHHFNPEQLLPFLHDKLPQLKSVKIGNLMCCQSFAIESGSIEKFSVMNMTDMRALICGLPRLRHLEVENCVDLEEPRLLDGLVLGREVKLVLGSMLAHKQPEALSGAGVPNLTELSLRRLPLQGDQLSSRGAALKSVTTLCLEQCDGLQHLTLQGWPQLSDVLVRQCGRLSKFSVEECPLLRSITVDTCNTVDQLRVSCERLEQLQIAHTWVCHFDVESAHLVELAVTGAMHLPGSTINLKCVALRRLKLAKSSELGEPVLERLLQCCPLVEDLSLNGCAKLLELHIPKSVTSLEVSNFRKLQQLVVSEGCRLRRLSLASLPKLQPSRALSVIEMNNECLEELEMSGMVKLNELTICCPRLHQLVISQCRDLTSAGLQCPQLSYFKLQACPRLSQLHLVVLKLRQLRIVRDTAIFSLTKLHLACGHIKFLARLLPQYCPRMKELILTGSFLDSARLHSVWQALPLLQRVVLINCTMSGKLADLVRSGSNLHQITAGQRTVEVEFQQPIVS